MRLVIADVNVFTELLKKEIKSTLVNGTFPLLILFTQSNSFLFFLKINNLIITIMGYLLLFIPAFIDLYKITKRINTEFIVCII